MKHPVIASLFLILALSACGAINQSFDIEDGSVVNDDLNTVNGSIRIGENATVNGEISTVNGNVRVGAGSSVGEAATVNGSVNLAENSVAGGVESVNGQIGLGDGARVNGDAATVNGSVVAGQRVVVTGDMTAVNGRISLERDSRVEGSATTVNGALTLRGAYVQGLTTVSGPVDILDGSIVEGELRVEEPRRSRDRDQIPRIVIGENSSVGGPLVFEREVELHVHESAQVGEIRGAEPRYYSGSEP